RGLTLPQRQECRDDVFEAPKEMIRPGEAFLRIAVAAEEIRLPRAIRGDARHLVDLGLIGDRIGGIRRGGSRDEIDLVTQDQFGCDLRSPRAARLTVLADDFDLIGLAAAFQAFRQKAPDLVEDEAVGFAEPGERTGAWTDVADLDDFRLRLGRDRAQHRRRCQHAETARYDGAPVDGSEAPKILCLAGHSAFSRSRDSFRWATSLARSAIC